MSRIFHLTRLAVICRNLDPIPLAGRPDMWTSQRTVLAEF